MINLEQVKLLEKKVAKAVDYIERLAKENAALHQQKKDLQTKMDSYQKRIDELEVLVTGFKEDQGRIEEGILAALDRLSQFEKAMEKSLKDRSVGAKAAREPAAVEKQTANAEDSAAGQTCFEIQEGETDGEVDIPDPLEDTAGADGEESGELDIF